MAENTFRVALAQVSPDIDVAGLCMEAAGKQADIVVFPEMFSNGYSRFDPDSEGSRQAWVDAAVSVDGAYVREFRKAALANSIAVVSTFLEQGDPKPFNSAVLISSAGDIILHQRKRHICFFDIPEEACAPGDSSKVAELNTKAGHVAVGLMICMDREYPHVTSDLVRSGAEIVLVPNSCPLVEDPEVGDVRVAGVRALAFQSVMGIAVANYPLPKHDGHSFAVDPLGKILVMGGKDQELVLVDFDIDRVRAIQTTEWFRRAQDC